MRQKSSPDNDAGLLVSILESNDPIEFSSTQENGGFLESALFRFVVAPLFALAGFVVLNFGMIARALAIAVAHLLALSAILVISIPFAVGAHLLLDLDKVAAFLVFIFFTLWGYFSVDTKYSLPGDQSSFHEMLQEARGSAAENLDFTPLISQLDHYVESNVASRR